MEIPLKETEVSAEKKCFQYHLILFQKGTEDDYINREVVKSIQDMLDEHITTIPQETSIDIWLESPGGDAHAAYKLILELRHRCTTLRAVIPDYAKSAATLLICGVDEIFMAPAAELGPLDAQIEHPDRENLTVSALDVAGSIDFLGETAMNLVLQGGAAIVHYTRMSKSQAFNSTVNLAASLFSPIVSKVDPHLLHQASNQLRIAELYAARLFAMRNTTSKPTIEQAQKLVKRLVNSYPAHGFVISRDEALRLGFPIKNAEDYQHWDIVRHLYDKFNGGRNSLICVIEDKELQKNLDNDNKNEEVCDGEDKENDEDCKTNGHNQESSVHPEHIESATI